jgi:ribosomal protein S27AE
MRQAARAREGDPVLFSATVVPSPQEARSETCEVEGGPSGSESAKGTYAGTRVAQGVCSRCGSSGPWSRQLQPWGVRGVCDPCWERQRADAWRLYRAARRAGTLTPPRRCSRCASGQKKLSGHHLDYNRPFYVRWLCATCHSWAHRQPGAGLG